jgi:phosphoglucosamine mutase
MISASHNPYYDNGIKIFNRFGEKADDELISRIEEYLDGKLSDLPYAVKGDIGRTVDFVAGRNRYIGYLVSLGVFSFKGVKVGLDLANGSAWSIGKSVFETLGASVSVIGAEPNGVNINDGVGSTRIENLQKLVKEKGLDIGFAYDGDADRCLCVDEKGQVVDGDEILYIYGRYMKERGKLIKNTIVTTVMSNFGLYKSLEELGIEYKQTAVGDRFVYEEMSKNGYMLGGEQSGHIIFSKYATTGDGVLTSLKVMQALLDKEKPLSYLAGQMQKYPQTLQSVKVSDKEKALSNPSVLQAIKTAENRLGADGRVLVRASGTEPVIRVMSEAKEKSLCDEIVSSIVWEIEKV